MSNSKANNVLNEITIQNEKYKVDCRAIYGPPTKMKAGSGAMEE
jgi:hypothetical protein